MAENKEENKEGNKEENEAVELGFNEAELSDIMNEIEDLEQNSEEEDSRPDVSAENNDVREDNQLGKALGITNVKENSSKELNVDKVAISKTEMQKEVDQEVDSLLENSAMVTETVNDNIVSINTASSETKDKNRTSMEFSISGEISMDLNFDISGKKISLTVKEDGLYIGMENGMKFIVPFCDSSELKKAI